MIRKELSPLLQESAKRSKDAKERERLRALYALSVGYPLPIVAEIFSVDEGTLYRWVERWQEEKQLSDKPKRGRPVSLTEKDKEVLKQLIVEGEPKKHGIDAEFWNTKELRDYFMKKGKDVSQETIRRTLKEMGARYVKPKPEQPRIDKKKQDEFLRRFNDEMSFNPYALLMMFDDEDSENSEKKAYGWVFQRKLN